MPDPMVMTEAKQHEDMASQERGERAGDVSVLACPLCGGVMWQTAEKRLAEFRCHVGHSFEGETLLDELRESIERGAWSLARALQERVMLTRELANLARQRDDTERAAHLDHEARTAEKHLRAVRETLLEQPE
jgi:two-component system chemotaxis response regulator CheB